MATPRQKVQVGVFLSICGVLLIGALVVLAGLRQEETLPYVIAFNESVSGLASGSDVRYRGVLVGRVTKIHVTPTNDIAVDVDIRPRMIQVRPGMIAQLASAGITGQLYIDLTGGAPAGEALAAGATIPSIPSLFTNISTALPTMLASTNSILLRIEKALGDEGEVQVILAAVEKLVGEFQSTMEGINVRTMAVLENFESLAGDDLTRLLQEFTATAEAARLFLERSGPVMREALSSSSESLARFERHVAALNPKRTGASVRTALDQVAQLSGKLGRTNEELILTLQSVRGDTTNVEFHFRQAVRSWRKTLESAEAFFEFLEQDPTALLIGRRAPGRRRDGSQR